MSSTFISRRPERTQNDAAVRIRLQRVAFQRVLVSLHPVEGSALLGVSAPLGFLPRLHVAHLHGKIPAARILTEDLIMSLKLFGTVFATVFLSELGDKTQLATILFASDAAKSKVIVFAASAGALVLSSGIGVLAGSALSRAVDPKHLTWAAGAGFIAIGVWTLVRA